MSKKAIVISGGSRGIGLAMAKMLKPSAENLVLVASRIESFDRVRDYFGDETSFHGCDVSSTEEIQSLSEVISSENDHIDVLINNSGVYLEKPFAESSNSEIQKLVEVNLRATLFLTRELLPLIEEGTNPQIINISSIAAIQNPAGQSIFSATKAAVTAFSNSLRKEVNSKGIRVSVIHPAGVNTWDDPAPEKLLRPEDIAFLVKYVIEADGNCQIDEITLSSLGY